jgi:hypothetical protein
MDVEGLKRTGQDLFGNSWQTRLARALGIDSSTVRRWISSNIPMPGYVEAFLAMMGERQEALGALTLERLPLGQPIETISPPSHEIERMRLRLRFPGVEQLKPMPAMTAALDEASGSVLLSLDGSPDDAIDVPAASYVLVRHPDGRHLAGYLKAALSKGHSAAVVSGNLHHYSAIVHDDQLRRIVRLIDTHSGTKRILTSSTDAPRDVIESEMR